MITPPPPVRDPEIYKHLDSRSEPKKRPGHLPQYEIVWFWKATGQPVEYDAEGFVIPIDSAEEKP